jgi:hypothetical protein
VGHGHEPHRAGTVVVEGPRQRLDRHLAVLVVRHHLDGHPEAPLRLEHADEAAGVLGVARQHPVAGPQPERPEGLVPGERGVLDEGDLAGAGADEGGDLCVGGGAVVGPFGGELVAAREGLGPQPLDLGVEHRAGGQAASGVVEVGHDVAAGRVRPGPLDVDAGRGAGTGRWRGGSEGHGDPSCPVPAAVPPGTLCPASHLRHICVGRGGRARC